MYFWQCIWQCKSDATSPPRQRHRMGPPLPRWQKQHETLVHQDGKQQSPVYRGKSIFSFSSEFPRLLAALPSWSLPPRAKESHARNIVLVTDGQPWSESNPSTETPLSYGCYQRLCQARLPAAPTFLVSMLFSCNLQSSPGTVKDVFIKGLVIFHLELTGLTSLMRQQPGHFSVSGRGVCLLGLSFIACGNSMPTSSPKQALLKDILPALGKNWSKSESHFLADLFFFF